MNPQYRQLGDDYWTPEIIATTWYQAETGKIPVSGAGYGGVFAGEGFDSCWTDMSEIVRPTRDGIHGREYISTTVDLGRKPMFLAFDEQGEMLFEPPPLMESPCRWSWRNRRWAPTRPGCARSSPPRPRTWAPWRSWPGRASAPTCWTGRRRLVPQCLPADFRPG